MRVLCCSIVLLLASVATHPAAAQATIAEWNFNAAANVSNASTGVGTSSGFAFPLSSALPLQSGSPNDANPVIVNGGPNNASGPRSGPNPAEAPGGRVARFNTSTAGFNAPTITWDFMQGYRSSRYYRLDVTYDGTSFVALPAGGSGSSISGAFGSASVDATGLITIETVDALIDVNTGVGFMQDLTYAFPAVSLANNNPNFGVRFFATWDPNGSDYVSSFAGTTSADTTSGYIRNTVLGGNQIRYDLVRIAGTAVPEPSSALQCIGALALLLGIRRPSGSSPERD